MPSLQYLSLNFKSTKTMTPKEKAIDNYAKEKHNIDECVGFVYGYEKCQEDMADKKYTEEDLKLAFETGRNFQLTGEDNFNELLNSLNKQD